MKKQKKIEFRVGLTVIIGLLLFIWILGWAKNIDLFTDKKTLVVRFESVSGLEVGDRIMIKGVRMGYVDQIFTRDNDVFVTALLDAETDLREDAEFAIMMLDLMGGKKIEVNPGKSETRIDYDEVQEGKFHGDISTVMASLSSVESDIIEVIHQIRISLNSLNEILGDGQFSSELSRTFANINDLANRITILVNENKEGIGELISNGNRLSVTAYDIMQENREVLNSTLNDISELVERTNKLTAKLDTLTEETMSGKNNLGKILYDEKLLTDMVEVLTLTGELMKVVLEQLKGEGVNVNADLF